MDFCSPLFERPKSAPSASSVFRVSPTAQPPRPPPATGEAPGLGGGSAAPLPRDPPGGAPGAEGAHSLESGGFSTGCVCLRESVGFSFGGCVNAESVFFFFFLRGCVDLFPFAEMNICVCCFCFVGFKANLSLACVVVLQAT